MSDRKIPRSIKFDRELVEEIEAEVDDSVMFENFSQYVRAAVRSFRDSNEGEFNEAQ